MPTSLNYANNAQTTLENNVTNTGVVITVSAGTGEDFPYSQFYCTIINPATLVTNEIIFVESRWIDGNPDKWIVQRSQQGTESPAGGWSAGSIVAQLPTAGDWENLTQRDEYTGNTTIPVGGIIYWPSSTILPSSSNYWLCNGASKNKDTYSQLFSVIGYTFGQVLFSTDYYIPNLQGLFIRGWNGTSSGYDPLRAFASVQQDTFRAHTHNVTQTFIADEKQRGSDNRYDASSLTTSNSGATGSTSWNADETRPYNIALSAYIRWI